MVALRSQLQELQAAVNQAVEEIEAQTLTEAAQRQAMQVLTDQLQAKSSELFQVQETMMPRQVRIITSHKACTNA